MADGIFFKNQNAAFDKLFKNIKNATENLINELDAEMAASVEEMATKSKQRAPVDTGLLRNSITTKKDSQLSYRLKSDIRYAAYVEFGTGPAAKEYTPTLEEDWKEYAWLFKSKKRDGHTPAQPFFYPSVREVFPIMIKRMENIIKE